MAVIVTNKRLLGFSVITNTWKEEDLRFNELPREVQAEGNLATVETDLRVFGFNAHNGEWLEAK